MAARSTVLVNPRRIKRLMDERAWRQMDLALAAKVNPRTIQLLMRRSNGDYPLEASIDQSTAIKIADAFQHSKPLAGLSTLLADESA